MPGPAQYAVTIIKMDHYALLFSWIHGSIIEIGKSVLHFLHNQLITNHYWLCDFGTFRCIWRRELFEVIAA